MEKKNTVKDDEENTIIGSDKEEKLDWACRRTGNS